jgi:mono/diheme cytochrome c family protein
MRTYLLALLMVVCLPSFALDASADRETPENNERKASQLYRRYCVSCHGTDGKAKTSKGKFSHARDMSDAQWQEEVSDERIFNSIMNGRNERGNMPAFANKLNENEVNSLVSFVRRLKG